MGIPRGEDSITESVQRLALTNDERALDDLQRTVERGDAIVMSSEMAELLLRHARHGLEAQLVGLDFEALEKAREGLSELFEMEFDDAYEPPGMLPQEAIDYNFDFAGPLRQRHLPDETYAEFVQGLRNELIEGRRARQKLNLIGDAISRLAKDGFITLSELNPDVSKTEPAA